MLTTLPIRTASQSKTFATRVLIYAGFFIPIKKNTYICHLLGRLYPLYLDFVKHSKAENS